MVSRLILKVDLSCCLCTKKIRRILYKYKERWDIHEITWDEKNNHIILVGHFNQEELAKKLCCKACKVIKEINWDDQSDESSVPDDQSDDSTSKSKGDDQSGSPQPTCTPIVLAIGQICACGPCHKGYQPCPCNCGTGRRPPCGCGCGGGYGYGYGYGYSCGPGGPPPPPASGGSTCHVYYEEDHNACTIM